MVFLPLTVWLLGKTYGKVKNLVLKIFQPFLTKLKTGEDQKEFKHIFSPGFATRGQDLPMLHSLYGKSSRIHNKTRRFENETRLYFIPHHPIASNVCCRCTTF